ncbi:hypothetical protein [Streptomyces sp. NPDC057939]|uniref:hypothetical protein n=1 Tax=Streptomyces sp. NPDC057939 TaxID=3346284 RepID=UPI0036E19A9D
MARIDVHTHLMVSLKSIAKEFSVQATFEELCDTGNREAIALALLNNEDARKGLDPKEVSLDDWIQGTLTDSATAIQQSFGPGSRFRVVLELLVGTPNGERIAYASSRIENITD